MTSHNEPCRALEELLMTPDCELCCAGCRASAPSSSRWRSSTRLTKSPSPLPSRRARRPVGAPRNPRASHAFRSRRPRTRGGRRCRRGASRSAWARRARRAGLHDVQRRAMGCCSHHPGKAHKQNTHTHTQYSRHVLLMYSSYRTMLNRPQVVMRPYPVAPAAPGTTCPSAGQSG